MLHAEPMQAGESLQFVVGTMYRLLQEQFGERDAAIFWRYDSGETAKEIAQLYHLNAARIRQIVSAVNRFLNECFSQDRLRILPVLQRLQTDGDRVNQILLWAGYTLDTLPETRLVKKEEQPLDAPPAKTEIDKLNLNSRCVTALLHRKITTIEDLCNLTHEELYIMRGIGPLSMAHIQQRLRELGLSIKQ